jgi:hypothetical protein
MRESFRRRSLGSARVSRAGCGVSPQQSLSLLGVTYSITFEKRKFAMTGRHGQHTRRVRYPECSVDG